MLEERVSNHRHQRMTMKAVPRPSLEVVEPEFLLQLRHRRIVDYQHGVAATNEPIRLNEQLCLQWRRVPDASRNKMMQLVVIARRKPLRHWLNALAIAGSDQPCHIKRTHSPPRFMAQAIQERLEPSSKLVFPIRRCAYHGRPSKSRPPMNH